MEKSHDHCQVGKRELFQKLPSLQLTARTPPFLDTEHLPGTLYTLSYLIFLQIFRVCIKNLLETQRNNLLKVTELTSNIYMEV